MKIRLLRKIQKHILEEPKRLAMSHWVLRKTVTMPQVYCTLDGSITSTREYPSCNTVGCIAGWAVLLAEGMGSECHLADVKYRAAALLGLSGKQADRLFEPMDWPKRYKAGLTNDGTPKAAKACVARIEHFIKTRGAK